MSTSGKRPSTLHEYLSEEVLASSAIRSALADFFAAGIALVVFKPLVDTPKTTSLSDRTPAAESESVDHVSNLSW